MSYHGIDEETGDRLYNKCDLIICDQETFGSAERSCDVDGMRESFHSFGLGISRLMRAMKIKELI